MDYDFLNSAYWQKQIERVCRDLGKITERPQRTLPGRVVPQEDELALGTGRRLQAAVMFTDICDFSARLAGTAVEQNLLLQILNLYFSEMIRVAEEYGGTVEKNTGDGLMAYFEDNSGDPTDSGSKRSVAAALTMMYINENAINIILEQSGIQKITFRIGIDYGPITIAQLGAAKRFGGLVAIGATANIANKMLADAQAGDILIGEDVYKSLPAYRQQFCALHKTSRGWIYVQSGLPYWFYRYTGRWKRPL